MQADTVKFAERLGNAIDVIANRLQVPAEFLWGILIRQAYAEFFTDLGIVITLGVVVAIGIRNLTWLLNNDRLPQAEQKPISDWRIWAVAIGVIVCLPLFFYVTFLLGDIAGVVNPEYFALKQILGVVK